MARKTNKRSHSRKHSNGQPRVPNARANSTTANANDDIVGYVLGLLPRVHLRSLKLSFAPDQLVSPGPRCHETTGRPTQTDGPAGTYPSEAPPPHPRLQNPHGGLSAGTRPQHSAVGARVSDLSAQSVSAPPSILLMLVRCGVSGGAGLVSLQHSLLVSFFYHHSLPPPRGLILRPLRSHNNGNVNL